MHKYLRSIGFSKYVKKKDIHRLLESIIDAPTSVDAVQTEHSTLVHMSQSFGNGIGITVCGEYDDEDAFQPEYYYPYLLGNLVSTKAPSLVERHAENDAFSGLCEESRLGISLIFYLQNSLDYIRFIQNGRTLGGRRGIILTALSTSGKILFPVKKTAAQIANLKSAANKRTNLIEAAKNGDEDAIESLTLEDIDLYAQVSRRLNKEDVYSIVDSYFMPSGVECDQYSILGEIKTIGKIENALTGEMVYSFLIDCNDMQFQVAINSMDLLGEPKAGRRFKGDVWIQGLMDFEVEDF